MSYIKSFQEQCWLLPPSIRDMIPEGHVCFLVEDFVNSLDFSDFDEQYGGAGAPAYHPRILMKIIVQGMLNRIRSSRRLSNACRESFVFMFLSEKVKPDFRTICRFRSDNADFIKDAFKETVKLAVEHDLVDLSFIGIDGSFVKANASRDSFVDREGFDLLDKVVSGIIEEDIAQDEIDMECGDKEINITGRKRDEIKRIVKNYFEKKNKEQAKKELCEMRRIFENTPNLKRINLSDPDCKLVLNKKGLYEPAYNVQFSVSKNQIILANDVCQDINDYHQLKPQIENIKENIGKIPKETKVAMDNGYNTTDNLHFLEKQKIDGYLPNREQAREINKKEKTVKEDDYFYDPKKDEIIFKGKRLKYRYSTLKRGQKWFGYASEDKSIIKEVPEHFESRLRMKEKTQTQEGKKTYSLRKITVEPVIGNIKQNLGIREFFHKRLNQVKTELNIISIAHNLTKIKNILKTKTNQKQATTQKNQKIQSFLAVHC